MSSSQSTTSNKEDTVSTPIPDVVESDNAPGVSLFTCDDDCNSPYKPIKVTMNGNVATFTLYEPKSPKLIEMNGTNTVMDQHNTLCFQDCTNPNTRSGPWGAAINQPSINLREMRAFRYKKDTSNARVPSTSDIIPPSPVITAQLSMDDFESDIADLPTADPATLTNTPYVFKPEHLAHAPTEGLSRIMDERVGVARHVYTSSYPVDYFETEVGIQQFQDSIQAIREAVLETSTVVMNNEKPCCDMAKGYHDHEPEVGVARLIRNINKERTEPVTGSLVFCYFCEGGTCLEYTKEIMCFGFLRRACDTCIETLKKNPQFYNPVLQQQPPPSTDFKIEDQLVACFYCHKALPCNQIKEATYDGVGVVSACEPCVLNIDRIAGIIKTNPELGLSNDTDPTPEQITKLEEELKKFKIIKPTSPPVDRSIFKSNAMSDLELSSYIRNLEIVPDKVD